MIHAVRSQLVSAERGFRKACKGAAWRAKSSRSFLGDGSPALVDAAAGGRSRGGPREEKQMKSGPRELGAEGSMHRGPGGLEH